MPARRKNPHPSSVLAARRTTRRHKPSRRSIDAGLSGTLLPASPPMSPLQESGENQKKGPYTHPGASSRSHNGDGDGDSDVNVDIPNVPRPRKRPRTQTPKEISISMDHIDPASMIFRIADLSPNVPMLKLWNDRTMKRHPGFVRPSDLTRIFAKEEGLSLYMGQFRDGFPSNLSGSIVPQEDLDHWRGELSRPPAQRRVMIFNPTDLAIVPYEKSPTVKHLESYIANTFKQCPASKQLRVYAAEYTSFHGLSDDVSHYVRKMAWRHSSPSMTSPASCERLHWQIEDTARDQVDCDNEQSHRAHREQISSSPYDTSFSVYKILPDLNRKPPQLSARDRFVIEPSHDGDSDLCPHMHNDSTCLALGCVWHGIFGPEAATLAGEDISLVRRYPIPDEQRNVVWHCSSHLSPPSDQRYISFANESALQFVSCGEDEVAKAERSWKISDGSCSSDDILSPSAVHCSPEETNRGSQTFMADKILEVGSFVDGKSRLLAAEADHVTRNSLKEDRNRLPDCFQQNIAGFLKLKAVSCLGENSMQLEERVPRREPKRYQMRGKNKFRTNPVGPEEGPLESEAYSAFVYLWNYDKKTRSDVLIPLNDAIEACRSSQGPFVGIYDGQDYDFRKGPYSWQINMFSYDLPKWARRGSDRDLRVRVWNQNQRSFRAYQFCPTTSGLKLWLKQHPDHSIFDPSALDLTYSALSILHGTPSPPYFSSSPRSRSVMLWNRLLGRVRQIGVSEVHPDALSSVEFWNAEKKCREKRKQFATRAELAQFLISHPWIELYEYQDEVQSFELSSGFRLIPILTNCPAEIACFWDNQSRTKYVQPRDDPNFKGRTIRECLSGGHSLELYLGQDMACFGALSSAVQRDQRSGCYPYPYMLAYSGNQARRFFSQGWIGVYIDVSRRNTRCAVFWNKREKKVQMQPEPALFMSIQEYLSRHSECIELYVGQDLAADVAEELLDWFQLLTFKPGYSPKSQKPMLTKSSFLPVSGVRNHRLDGNRVKPFGRNDVLGKPQTEKSIIPAARTSEEEGRIDSRQTNGERSASKRLSAFVGAVNTRTSSSKATPLGRPLCDLKATREQFLHITKCSDDNHDGSTAVLSIQSPESSTCNEHESLESSLLQHDHENVQGGPTNNEALEMPTAEVPLSRTREKANRISNLIKEAGPKVLNRQLKQDIRQSLREDLLLDVNSSDILVVLARRLRTSDFVSAAVDLCARLESLDDQCCFSHTTEFGYGPPDLLSVRADLESGKIYTIADVTQKFRLICEDLIQYHEDGVYENEAHLLKYYGEEVIAEFSAENRKLVLEEERISRIARICEKARKIGFQQLEARRRTQNISGRTSPAKAKQSIRVSGYRSDVTYLNYRDEKGYSVMGKRHSARVFGLSIDTRTCEVRAGNYLPCHVCGRGIFKSDGNALQCANGILGLCQETICRSCLESVFSINEKEFGRLRTSNDWICVHCRGLCVQKGPGELSRCPMSDRNHSFPEVDAQFVWSHGTSLASSVSITIAKRSIGGEFEAFENGTTLSLAKQESDLIWSTMARLSVGAYRCRIDTDNIWAFSTTFLVLPTQVDKQQRNAWNEKSSIESSETLMSERPATFSRVSERQQIEWNVAKIQRMDSGPVHSFSTRNGGAFVQMCSRTEGYDWRRSKRHAVVQWIPEKSRSSSIELRNMEERSVQVLKFSASPKGITSTCHRGSFPRLQIGMSWRRFVQDVDAFKFDHMRNETLWGIVTGTSRIHGIGLFTLTGYQAGDFVIEYAGDLIRTPLADIREKRYEAEGLGTYLFKIDENQIVDATVKSNRARFTNHSCDPNMASQIVNVRGRDLVVLIATRNIPPFAELTFNYQLPYEEKKLECLCNSWNCVGVMN